VKVPLLLQGGGHRDHFVGLGDSAIYLASQLFNLGLKPLVLHIAIWDGLVGFHP
jgi:hypothetical protein